MVDIVNTRPLELECYPMTARPPDLVPGRQSRNWMDAFISRHPGRSSASACRLPGETTSRLTNSIRDLITLHTVADPQPL